MVRAVIANYSCKGQIQSMTPWFIATEPFGPDDGERWQKYIKWSRLTQLSEVVSLDSSLCPSVLPDVKDDFWPHIVNEDYMLAYFTDLEFLKKQVSTVNRFNMLCVLRNPVHHDEKAPMEGFEFIGYDLIEARTGISALNNCGGFPEVFSKGELSPHGLLTDFERAVDVRSTLRSKCPNEPHANCDLWAIFRAIQE